MKKIFLLLLLCALSFAACDTATPTPSLPANPTNFQDDFSKNTGFWQTFTEPKSTAKIAEGTLNLSVTDVFTVGFSVAALNLSDFDFTVTSNQVSAGNANGYGLIFRYVDQQNFYRFDISGDARWNVSRRWREQWLQLTALTAHPAIKGGAAANVLRVVARGDKFEFYANGVLLGTLTDANLPIGRIGVLVSTFDDAKAEVKFDNVKVVKPN